MFAQLLRRHDISGMNLESLIVEYERRAAKSDIVVENIRESLISYAHSLTLLSIPSWLTSREVLVTIFNQLKKLTTLEILTDSVDEGSWMENIPPHGISHVLLLKTLKVNRVVAVNGLRTIL